MIESMSIINDEGQLVNINIIVRFRIEEFNKEYIVYTLNDDGKSEIEPLIIAGIVETSEGLKLRLIPEEEQNTVLVFYDNVRDTLTGKR